MKFTKRNWEYPFFEKYLQSQESWHTQEFVLMVEAI